MTTPSIFLRRALGAAILAYLFTAAATGPTAAQSPLAALAGELVTKLDDTTSPLALRVILEGDASDVVAAAERHGAVVERVLDQFVVVSATPLQIVALRLEPAVKLIAGDLRVQPMMVVSDQAMGADQTRAGGSGLFGVGYPGVTGRGVAVAIVDSGIAPHAALANKVVAAVSFVPGDPGTNDEFGHGTHIAGIVAGSGAPAARVTRAYAGGVAPGANLVNVRVLDEMGGGYTSSVIAGLDWVIANRARYGIRIVNLSLGHPVTAPCVFDPLCLSVARAVGAGLIVVTSAGNRGAAPSGLPVFGTVTTPGNSPAALTVGALNTWGTVDRSDDTVTSYSSHGPAPYDVLIKPDVVAPGNKIVSLEAPRSYLATQYRALHVAGSSNNAYYTMSGTSMAAGMVSGGLALLAEAFPGLTPLQAKLALQLTATPKRDGLMASGAGSINLWSARKLLGNNLTLVLPTSMIGGVVSKSGGLAFADHGRLMQRLYDGSGIWWLLGGTLQSLLNTSAADALYVFGLQNPFSIASANQILWGDQVFGANGQQILWGDQILWGEQIFNASGQQILWGDQILWGEQVLWGDQILWGDQTPEGQQILWGDSMTASDPH
jgi:serine protease AprX